MAGLRVVGARHHGALGLVHFVARRRREASSRGRDRGTTTNRFHSWRQTPGKLAVGTRVCCSGGCGVKQDGGFAPPQRVPSVPSGAVRAAPRGSSHRPFDPLKPPRGPARRASQSVARPSCTRRATLLACVGTSWSAHHGCSVAAASIATPSRCRGAGSASLRAPKPRSAPLAVRCATDAAAVAHECNRVRAAARRLRCALKPVTAAIVSPTLTARASVLRTAHLMNCAHLVRRPALAHDGFRCSGALSSLIRGRHCVRGSSGRRPAAQAPSALGATDVRVLDAHARRGRARPSDARRV